MKHVRLATSDDDPQLRALLRETPMQGKICLTAERETSFFGGSIDVKCHGTVLLGDSGCASRSLRSAWWHGKPTEVAYLCDLRVHPKHRLRSGLLLRRAFEFADALAIEHPAAVTWTAIFEANDSARAALENGRAGLPAYHDRGRLICPLLLTRGRSHLPHATDKDWPEIAQFLNATLSHRPLAPVQSEEDFRAGVRWPGLRAEDFLLVRRNGKLVGTLAVFDVRPFRQVRVQSVPVWLRCLHGPSKVISSLTGLPALPKAGDILPVAFASFLSVSNNDAALARELLIAARGAAAQRGIGYLCVCMHERDPLVACVKGLPMIASHGRLYEVTRESPVEWGSQVPVVEGVAL